MKSSETGKKAVIVGASSGIGLEVARLMAADGWRLGLAARRTEPLERLAREFPGRVEWEAIDLTADGAEARLRELIGRMGGIGLYLHVAGVGWQNPSLEAGKELLTVATNSMGFARMVGEAYRYFAERGGGHIAVVSSIAGTKGLGVAPAYSATKAFDNVYIQALEQQAMLRRLPIRFTDIRPGFVRTNLLNDGKSYPMLMDSRRVAAAAVRAIAKGHHICVIDWRWRVLTALWRRMPRWLWRRMPVKN